jgi:hypothetical protein
LRTAAKTIVGLAVLTSCSSQTLVAVGDDRPVHRYSFEGTGTTAVDSIGGADGAIIGAQLSGNGTLVLPGGFGDQSKYVALPPALVSGLVDATFEAWVNWAGPAGDGSKTPWQRIFDFGEGSTGIAGEQAAPGVPARSYLFLTAQSVPRSASEVPSTRVTLQVPHSPQAVTYETFVDASPLPIGVDSHVGVVIDAKNHQMSLFVNGNVVGSTVLMPDNPLGEITDINDWLGRSQFPQDNGFTGTYIEFRIYAVALTPAEIRTSYESGPRAVL